MASAPEVRFCGCCSGPSPRTPLSIWNRPGLPTIVVRAGTFATFREAMLEDIIRQPALSALATRETDDYAITLVELFAGVGDVLTFYTDRISNELFLRTAHDRDSLLRLVRLIGYRLRPGLAATTLLAFTLDNGYATRIRKGLKVMSIPAQDERPQTFEAIEALTADARLNALPIYAAPLPFNAFRAGSSSAPLVARPQSLSVGDRLVMFGADTLEEKTVAALSVARDGERIVFSPPVQATTLVSTVTRAARVERRLRFFGHDAPDRYQAYDTNAATPPALRWKTITTADPGYQLGFAAGVTSYPLDARIETLTPGARLLIDAGPSANPRLRTAVVTAVDDAPAILGNVANTAPHRAETVTYASLMQTIRGRPALIVHPTGLHLAVRSGVGRTLGFSSGNTAWAPIGNIVAADDGALVSSGAATVELIVRAADGTVHRSTRAAGAWGTWTPLLALATAGPAALLLVSGEVLVCIRSAFFDLQVHSLATPGWQSLGGIITSPPVPVSWNGSRVDVFARGLDRALWRRTRVGGSWAEWESLGGQLATAPAAASTAPDRLDVVALDDAGALVHRRWTGSSWTEWVTLGGRATDEPAILATGPDRVDVFVRGEDNQLWQITRSAATWGSWVPRGGVLGSAPFAVRAGGVIAIVARDTDDVAVLTVGNGTFFTPFQRFGGGLGEIPDRRQTRIFVTTAPDVAFRDYDYPAHLAGGRLTARLADAPGLGPIDKGRRIVIEAGTVRHVASVTASRTFAATPGGIPDHVLVDFSPPLEAPVDAAALHGNIVQASHGETQPDEPVGSGDATREFPKYRLRRAPLTYLQRGGRIEGVAELELRVNGERWHEVASLYARGPLERVYTARQTDAGETEVTFGDGRNGARLPSGAGNVVAHYRTGSGLAGNLRAEQLAIPMERPVGLRAVTNPFAAGGGADPETRDRARSAAPTTVRTFGRAVSLQDFAWLATTSGVVARAYATWVWQTLEKAVHLTVAGVGGAALPPDVLNTLHAALTSARDPNRVLLIANLVRVPIVVRAKVLRDPDFLADDVRAAATEALLAAFSFESMALGQAVHASDVFAAMQGARGVRAVDVDLLHLNGHQTLMPVERALRAVTADPVQQHIRIFEARPTPADPSQIDRYARAGFTGSALPPVLSAEQAYIDNPSRDVEIAVVEAL